jgi:hypothetical protein
LPFHIFRLKTWQIVQKEWYRTYGFLAERYRGMHRAYPNTYRKHAMKIRSVTFSLALLMSLASVSTTSSAGCLKGAVVGGVAGHVAGKHSVLGAAAGCAVGHHMSKKKAREQAAADARAREQQRQANAAPPRR